MKTTSAVTALFALLLACGPRSQTDSRIHASLEALIPADTLQLAYIRFDPIRSSPLYQRYIARLEMPALDRFIELTGLDPRRDLHDLVIASDNKNALFLIRADLKPAVLEKKLGEQRVPTFTYNGRTLFGTESSAFAVVNSTVAAAGPAPLVRATLDRAAKPAPMAEELVVRIREIPASHQIWAVSLAGIPALDVPARSNLGNLSRALASMKSGAGSADVSRGLSLSATAIYKGEAEAKQVHGALRAVLALGRLSTPSDKPEVLRFYDAFQVRLEGDTVRLDASVSSDVLENTLRHFDSLARSR